MELDPVAVALKFGFLAVLYLFLLWMARSAMKDLRRGAGGAPAAYADDATGMHAASQGLKSDAGGQPKLRVETAAGLKAGSAYSLSDGAFRFLAAGRTPLFLSDSRRLLFQTVGGGLALIDMQDGRIRPVLPDGTIRTGSGGLEVSLSSDDRKIAYIETHREGDVWLMHLAPASSKR